MVVVDGGGRWWLRVLEFLVFESLSVIVILGIPDRY